MVDDELEESNEEDQTAKEEKAIIYADRDLSIVVQRNLRVASEENDEVLLCKNVFHTKCTAEGKVCLVIIDSGSFENLFSMEMVQKLSLKTIPHLNPYKLCWMQKGSERKVSTRCLVEFSIGKYKDEVWCDMTPMDAYHLLLGRSWLYDRHVLYDGFKNTFFQQGWY